MPNAAQPASIPPNSGSSGSPSTAERRRRRWWFWYGLTGALIVALFAGQLAAGSFFKSQARLCISNREPQAALDWLQWSAWVDRRDAEAEFLRGRACRKLGEFNLVREHLDRAHKLGYPVKTLEREQYLALAQAGQLPEAEPHLGELLTDPQGDEAEICEAYVHGLTLNRRYADAFQMLTPWIADCPDSPQPLYIRGHIQNLLQRYKLAETDLRQALKLDPRHAATAYELGDVLEQLHQPAEALTYYERAAKFPNFEMLAGVGRSRCLKVLGKNAEARTAILKVIEKFPQEPLPHQALGQIELEAGNYAEALKQLDIAAVRLGYDKELRNARGSALRGLKRNDEARREFEFVDAANRAMSRAHDLQEIVQADPSDYKSRFEIGQIFLKYSEPREGVIWLQSVLNYMPHHRGTHQALADYYAKRANDAPTFRELAAKHLKEAQAAPPDEPQKTTDAAKNQPASTTDPDTKSTSGSSP